MKSGLSVLACVIALSLGAVAVVQTNGWTLYYGDAEAHLAIARRVVDSRTPGYDQIGTVWLPLPHLLMLPWVRDDRLWRTGLAGTIPGVSCWVCACWFLFAAARRALGSVEAAWVAAGCFALNPCLLYLQAIPMTEAVFAAASAGLAVLHAAVCGDAEGRFCFGGRAGGAGGDDDAV